MSTRTKAKHFTSTKKKYFIELIKNVSHIIESKKTNTATLSEKEEAWGIVCAEFNNSAIVTEKRSIPQLKKLWTNMKQVQRDALTKEKQSILATGGGPQIRSIEIDPDISAIAPFLMATAPTQFSSNMTEEELRERRDNIAFVEQSEVVIECDTMATENMASTSTVEPSPTSSHQQPLPGPSICKVSRPRGYSPPPRPPPRKRLCSSSRSTSTASAAVAQSEENLKAERVQRIMEQEEILFGIKVKHEEEIHNIQVEHLKQKLALEVRAATAQAEFAELLLEKEKARM